MKIGIMGTHGAGKTTFALRMVAELKKNHPGENVGMLTEVARQCPFTINKNTTREAQLWIFHMQIPAEIEMAAKNEILVCDRTILDPLVYAQWAGFADLVDAYLPIAIDWAGTYDEIYWARPGSGRLTDDGFRSVDTGFQKEIDRIFAAWFRDYNIPATRCCFGGAKI